MNAKKVLIPIDFSEASLSVLDYAATLAKESQGELIIVNVREIYPLYPVEGQISDLAPDRVSLRHILEAIKPSVPGAHVSHRLLEGAPADAIVDFARREHADLIVMATHGRTGLAHLLMGSVAEAVVQNAECPVLTLKSKDVAAAPAVHS